VLGGIGYLSIGLMIVLVLAFLTRGSAEPDAIDDTSATRRPLRSTAPPTPLPPPASMAP
jgi:hypothetical protein